MHHYKAKIPKNISHPCSWPLANCCLGPHIEPPPPKKWNSCCFLWLLGMRLIAGTISYCVCCQVRPLMVTSHRWWWCSLSTTSLHRRLRHRLRFRCLQRLVSPTSLLLVPSPTPTQTTKCRRRHHRPWRRHHRLPQHPVLHCLELSSRSWRRPSALARRSRRCPCHLASHHRPLTISHWRLSTMDPSPLRHSWPA